jgi:hypothetical protein
VGRCEQTNTRQAAILLHAMGVLDGLIVYRRTDPAFGYISQGVRLPGGLRSRAPQRYQEQHRGYVLQESHHLSTSQTALMSG